MGTKVNGVEESGERERFAVAIPIYKDRPDEWETFSIKRCLRVFAGRPIVFFHRRNMDLSIYRQLADGVPALVRFVAFGPEWYRSIWTYNELMLSPGFYRAFLQYEYILLYQPDAYVFADRVEEFIAAGVDYLGAPCFEGRTHAAEIKPTGHLNGGFSLRNTAKCMDVCRRSRSLAGIWRLYRARYIGKHDLLCILCRMCGRKDDAKRPFHWEDMFFSFGAPILDHGFRVGGFDAAAAFAFDCLPEKMLEYTGGALPMGCHDCYGHGRWEFWRAHAEQDDGAPI